MFSTIPNPFYVDLSDPQFSRQVNKQVTIISRRRPSESEIRQKVVVLNAKLDKKRIQLDKLCKEIPELLIEALLWKKYQQHKEQQDKQKLAVEEEEEQLRLEQHELEKKKDELRERKRISTRRPMLNTAAESNIDNFQPVSDKISIFVVDMVGKSHCVEIIPTAAIDELFDYVFAGFTDIPKELCSLRTAVNTLELGKTFAEQGVEAQSSIYMKIRQVGGARGGKIKIKGKKKSKKTGFYTIGIKSEGNATDNLLQAILESQGDELKELDALFASMNASGDESVSLGDDSERSGADEEYQRGKDPNWVPKEDDEGDEEGDSFDDCEHEWLNSAGLCFDCGVDTTPAPCFPTTPFQPVSLRGSGLGMPGLGPVFSK